MPKFSIIIPTYNRKDVILQAIDSVLNQTEIDWELIIIDDGSQDGTSKLLAPILEDHRIHYFGQENFGVCVARNAGAERAVGDFLIFLDSDDKLFPNCLSEILSNQHSEIKIAQWGVRWEFGEYYEDRLPIGKSYFPFLTGSFIIRRDFFVEIGGYDLELKFGENTELFHRAFLRDPKVLKFPFLGLYYIKNPFGGSKNLQNMIDSNQLILKKHQSTLSNHSKHLYHQVIGVNQIRFRRFSEARKHLWQAYILQPGKLPTLGRYLISCLPLLAKRLYSTEVKIK